jgi:hypothetical protein
MASVIKAICCCASDILERFDRCKAEGREILRGRLLAHANVIEEGASKAGYGPATPGYITRLREALTGAPLSAARRSTTAL